MPVSPTCDTHPACENSRSTAEAPFDAPSSTGVGIDDARRINADHGLKSIIMFGNQVPDELGINISAAIHGIEPHKYKWIPALWPRLHGGSTTNFEDIYSRYYLLSCGSNYATGDIKKLYDRIVKCAANKFQTQHLFPLIDKKIIHP